MQTAIDTVAQSFTLKPPMSDRQSGEVREEAALFALQLLTNFKDQLEKRPQKPD